LADDSEKAQHRAAVFSATQYAGISLPNQPRLARWAVPVDLGDGRLQFRSAESVHTLNHPLLVRAYHQVEKFLDGTRTVEEITSLIDTDFEPTTVVFLLKLLHGKGLLQDGDDTAPDGAHDQIWHRQVRFLSHFVPNATRAQSELAAAHVGVVGSADLRRGIVAGLETAGMNRVTEMTEPPIGADASAPIDTLDLLIACQASPAFAFFDAVNRTCLATRTRWLRVSVSATFAQLGPTFVPFETACHTCLELRRQTHEPDVAGYLAYRDRTDAGDVVRDDGPAALSTVIFGQVALEVARILVGHTAPTTFGRYFDLSALSPLSTVHDVLKVPRCESCGGRMSYSEAWDQTALPTALS
jgi:bacteriocin biosynthesis cyclodehydratase domain-containing protein